MKSLLNRKAYLTVGVLIFFMIMIFRANSPKSLVEEIKRPYKGYVSNIYSIRGGYIIRIKTETDELDLSGCTNKFMCSIDVGDVIYKKADDNYVTIVKRSGGKIIELPYLYINPGVRKDFRWPDEWDNKWMEAGLETCDSCYCEEHLEKYKFK